MSLELLQPCRGYASMAGFLTIVVASIVTSVVPALAGAADDQEIQYLIMSVQSLHDATFERNGSSYDAARAADHLRRKLKYAGSRVKSAEDFISLCATASSASGKPYEIHFSDGRTVTSAAFLRDRLAEYRKERGAGVASPTHAFPYNKRNPDRVSGVST